MNIFYIISILINNETLRLFFNLQIHLPEIQSNYFCMLLTPNLGILVGLPCSFTTN